MEQNNNMNSILSLMVDSEILASFAYRELLEDNAITVMKIKRLKRVKAMNYGMTSPIKKNIKILMLVGQVKMEKYFMVIKIMLKLVVRADLLINITLQTPLFMIHKL